MKHLTMAAALLVALMMPGRAWAQTVVSGWLDVTAPISPGVSGAIPNDGLDDTFAIQTWANAMVNPDKSVLYFPPGEYHVSSTIVLGHSGIVAGDGMERSVIVATAPAMTVFSTAGTTGRVVFRDFKISKNVPKTAGAGILLKTTSPTDGAQQHARIENVWFHEQYRGVEVANAAYWTIRDSVFSDSVSDGILVQVSSNPDAGDNLVSGCVFSGGATGIGIHLGSSGGQKIIGNKILGHGIGLLVQPTATAVPMVDILISNNSIENQSTYGMLWQTPVAGTAIVNSHIVGNQLAGQDGPGIAVSGNVGGLVVNSNQVTVDAATGGAGIYITPSGTGTPGQFTIVGNTITGTAPAGSVGISAGNIPGAEIHSNWVAGVAIPYQAIGGRVSDASFSAATLPAAANGSQVYCQDCAIAAACAGGGTGAFAKRINGAWMCQ